MIGERMTPVGRHVQRCLGHQATPNLDRRSGPRHHRPSRMQGRSSDATGSGIKEAQTYEWGNNKASGARPRRFARTFRPARGLLLIHHQLFLAPLTVPANRVTDMDAFFDVRSSFNSQMDPYYWSLIAKYSSQDIQKRMLGREWLTKVDNETSTPYLLVSQTSSIARTLTGL